MDSAAIVKMIHPEAESVALQEWLKGHSGQPGVSSALIEVEVPRSIRRIAPERISRIAAVLAGIERIEVDTAVRGVAAQLEMSSLRSLDAIHLATAIQFGPNVDHFVTYDKRLLAAASTMGLPVASPGSSLN